MAGRAKARAPAHEINSGSEGHREFGILESIEVGAGAAGLARWRNSGIVRSGPTGQLGNQFGDQSDRHVASDAGVDLGSRVTRQTIPAKLTTGCQDRPARISTSITAVGPQMPDLRSRKSAL
jgi:hypothetical protein